MRLGEVNSLTVLRFTSVGAYLGDDLDNDLLLPNKYITDDLQEGDLTDVFLYRDSEDRIVATTERPLIELNGFAFLKAKEVTFFGAFVDWGLEKDLLIPFKEQNLKLEEDRYYLTYLYLDESTDRLVGSTKVNKYIQECQEPFEVNDEVELLICENTDLGLKVIVNNRYSGLIFNNFISRPVKRGDYTKGYIQKVREDGKLDVTLEITGFTRITESAEKLLAILKKNNRLAINDKSDPELIRETVGMSKKTFKQAVGGLYKERLIELADGGINYIGPKD